MWVLQPQVMQVYFTIYHLVNGICIWGADSDVYCLVLERCLIGYMMRGKASWYFEGVHVKCVYCILTIDTNTNHQGT